MKKRRPRRPLDIPGSRVRDAEQTIVYRLYAEGGELLYVGVTSNLHKRLLLHRLTKPWFDGVARVEHLTFPTPWAARHSESTAIATLQPLHNVRDKDRRPSDFLRSSEWRCLFPPVRLERRHVA